MEVIQQEEIKQDLLEGRPSRQFLKDIPIVWVRKEALELVSVPNQIFQAKLYAETFTYQSVNVVAKVKGNDPKLANEYVLFSGHTDHDGVRNIEPGKDSILNGAMTMRQPAGCT